MIFVICFSSYSVAPLVLSLRSKLRIYDETVRGGCRVLRKSVRRSRLRVLDLLYRCRDTGSVVGCQASSMLFEPFS